MGYAGPPSKGCDACRRRKIKCDQNPEGCRQCARSRKPCPGYRNYVDLIFKDQSYSVKKKVSSATGSWGSNSTTPLDERLHAVAQGISVNKKILSTVTAGISNTGFGSDIHVNSDTSHAVRSTSKLETSQTVRNDFYQNISSYSQVVPMRATPILWQNQAPKDVYFTSPLGVCLYPTVNDLGTAVFFKQYARQPPPYCNNFPSPTFFDFASTILSRDTSNQTALSCIMAVGLAGLANIRQHDHVMFEARKYYVRGLNLVNKALHTPSDAVQDTTLLSVMLLQFFELITCTGRKFMRIRTQHIKGASILVKLRGNEQFTSEVGLRMFQQLCHTLAINCIQNGLPVPQHIIHLRRECKKYVDTRSVVWLTSEITIKLASLRSRVMNGSLTSPEQILQEALSLDDQFKSLYDRLATERPYETRFDQANPRIYRGTYHIYPKMWTMYAWNNIRSGRCLLHHLIRMEMLKGFSAIPPRYLTPECTVIFETSLDVILQMLREILASAPHTIGWVPSEIPIEAISRGRHMLIWPFYIASHICIELDIFSTDDQIQSYIACVLSEIGLTTGILTATQLGRVMEDKTNHKWLPRLHNDTYSDVLDSYAEDAEGWDYEL
ncbi:Zn(II)2Cys6 transcription factor [Aspergillus tanneri]|nr:uncharacterized protein ATNIH1004_008408 [Aspergillus tanneri]KAA8644209.1 hypothetical protein ATNIH1004_008408 [Aspergillus tanneri]